MSDEVDVHNGQRVHLRNHLTPQVTWYIGYVYPAEIIFSNQLSKPNLPLQLHLPYEVKQLSVLRFRARDEVCRTSQQVVTVLCATHERVQLLTSIATADHDRLSPRLAYGVKELFY